MAGILDSKSRVLDTFITNVGRSQLTGGKLKISYAHFTDSTIVYAADVASGTDDATTNLYLESSNLPQDQITFEADDSGKLLPFPTDTEEQLYAGQLLSFSFTANTSSIYSGSSEKLDTSTDVTFSSQINGVLGSSLTNFQKLQILGTTDAFNDEDLFAFGPNRVGFKITDEQPINDKNDWQTDINHLESIFNDPRFDQLTNFSYLPPLNRVTDPLLDKSNVRLLRDFYLGDYEPIGTIDTLDGDTIMQELQSYEEAGFMKVVSFDPTSRNNRISAQFFELTSLSVKKLDVIDYGKVTTNDGIKHVFFVGKIMIDDYDVQKFIHIFTLVFE